jgi:hypothetical protein
LPPKAREGACFGRSVTSWTSGSGLTRTGLRAGRWRRCAPSSGSRANGVQDLQSLQRLRRAGLYRPQPAAYRQANRLPAQLEAVIVHLEREYPSWGAPKIREKLTPFKSAVSRYPAMLCHKTIGLKFLSSNDLTHGIAGRRPTTSRGGTPLEPRRDPTFSSVIGHDPLFQARIGAVACVGPRHDEPGCASSWLKDRSARVLRLIRVGKVKTGAISGCRADGEDRSSVSKRDQRHLLVGSVPIGSKRTRTRAGSNGMMLPFSKASTSWGRQRLRQCPRLPATLAAELDDRRLSRGTHREQRSEISIRGDDDSMLGGSAFEDHFVVCVLQS